MSEFEEVLLRLTGREVNPGEYTVIATARGHKVLYFERYGDYQGEWLMLSQLGRNLYLWKDYYGSCSGCDALEAADLDSSSETELERKNKIAEFVAKYKPFAEFTISLGQKFAREGQLSEIMPANIRLREPFKFDDAEETAFRNHAGKYSLTRTF